MTSGPSSRNPPEVPDHTLLRCIGSGSYGEVWLARNVMGTYRAVKVVYRQTFENDRPYEREFNGLKRFEPISRSHDGLIDILQVGRNEAAGYYYCVMELCDDTVAGQAIDPERYHPRTLAEELSRRDRLTFAECLQIGLSVSDALSHLHKHGLTHRDIKPSNLIFVHGIAKIADIGLVTELGAPQSFVGTQGFIPPEGPGTAQADIYSLGKVLYEISSGKDRQAYPELPTQLDTLSDQTDYLELNEVILKACAGDARQRYRSAEDMHADLLLLQAGKSVKRLRALERRLVLLTRFGAVATALLVLGLIAYYQIWKAQRRETGRLIESYVAHGVRSVEGGDLIGSLPWFAEGLGLCEKAGQSEEAPRVRLAAVLARCPRIVDLWLEGDVVNSSEFSPDGRRVVTARKDGRCTVWDVQTGTRLVELVGHTNEVQTACFSPDGGRLLTASLDQTARLWDAQTGLQIGIPLNHPAGLYSARFSPDGSRIVTACGGESNGFVRIWQATGGEWQLAQKLPERNQAFRCATFSPDGLAVATANEDGTAEIWDLAPHLKVAHTIRHRSSQWVYSVAFSPDGRYVASASYDRTVLVYDLKEERLLPPLAHPGTVHGVTFSPDGRRLATASLDFTARIWDFRVAEIIGTLGHSGNVLCAQFGPDGRHLVTCGIDGITRIWDLSPLDLSPPSLQPCYSEDGQVSATLTDRRAEIRNAGTDRVLATVTLTNPAVDQLRLNADGGRMLALSGEIAAKVGGSRLAQVWETATGVARSRPFPADDSITNAVLSPDGTRLITFQTNVAWLWDTLQGRPVAGPLRHEDAVTEACFSSTGRRFVSLSTSLVCLWDAATGVIVRTLPHDSEVRHAEFSPDGQWLVTCCSDWGFEPRYAQVWDARTGGPVGARLNHRDGVLHASFSPDSRRVVTASEDTTAQVWELNTSQSRITLKHKDEVYEARFSTDGKRITTACRDGTVRIWLAETGTTLTPPVRIWGPNVSWGVQFVGNGSTVLVSRANGEAYLVGFPPDTNSVQTILQLAQLLSGHRGDLTGGLSPLTTNLLWKTWQDLRRPGFTEPLFSTANLESWHLREAAASERAGEWFAAVFHLDRLVRMQPGNEDLQGRLDQARARSDPARRTSN
jgi:WD40 repeat protein